MSGDTDRAPYALRDARATMQMLLTGEAAQAARAREARIREARDKVLETAREARDGIVQMQRLLRAIDAMIAVEAEGETP